MPSKATAIKNHPNKHRVGAEVRQFGRENQGQCGHVLHAAGAARSQAMHELREDELRLTKHER